MSETMTKLKPRKRPIAIDLFAGAGGLSLGFEQAGFDVWAAVEVDPIHCAVHEFNFPQTKIICASVSDLTGAKIRSLAGIGERDIDAVIGGAPCQGFSLIGKRSIDDPRNFLVQDFVRLVQELQPKFCVFENVKGLTVGKHKQFLTELIESLQLAGYSVKLPYQVLNAADFGVPQNRHRLFLIAGRKTETLPDYPAPTAGRTLVAQAISDLPNADDFAELLEVDEVQCQWSAKSIYAKHLRGLLTDDSDFSYPRVFELNRLTASLRTTHTDVSINRFKNTQCGQTEPISRFLKLSPTGLCNTLRAGTDTARGAFTSARPIHPLYPRVITVREAARLHSYPDWFRFHATKWHGFRQVGNSVPPMLARSVAAQLMKVLKIKPYKPDQQLALTDKSLLALNMQQASSRFGLETKVIASRTRLRGLL